jgi:hypothetical protein
MTDFFASQVPRILEDVVEKSLLVKPRSPIERQNFTFMLVTTLSMLLVPVLFSFLVCDLNTTLLYRLIFMMKFAIREIYLFSLHKEIFEITL